MWVPRAKPSHRKMLRNHILHLISKSWKMRCIGESPTMIIINPNKWTKNFKNAEASRLEMLMELEYNKVSNSLKGQIVVTGNYRNVPEVHY